MRSVFLALSVAASCIAAEDGWYAAVGDIGDQHYRSQVTWIQIEQAPQWSPKAQEMPPLAPGRAELIARKELDRLIPSGQTWDLHAVRIVDAGRSHWLYEVSFERQFPSDMAVFGAHFMDILVLMDGTAIEPKPVSLPGPDHPR